MKCSTPSKQGVNPRGIINFIDEMSRENIELHGVVIIKNGYVVAEGYWKPYSKDRVHQLCSVTKTFTAMAIGFAIDEGYMSVDDTLYKFFPDKFPGNADERTKDITIHDLLCMASGFESEPSLIEAGDAVKAFLSKKQLHTPGTQFRYNSVGSHMLSEILYKVTGVQVSEYLKPRLFEPLGIENFKWLRTPQGSDFGGAGLHLTTMDIAKAGLLLLQKGEWEGKQILPRFWAESMAEKKIDSVPEGPEWLDWAQGYCYQMWCGTQEGSYRLDGAFGQYSMVFPKENMVIAFTAANNDRPLTKHIMKKHLFDVIDIEDAEGDTLLKEKLDTLSVKEVVKANRSETEKEVHSKSYYIEENEMSLVPLSEKWFVCEYNKGIDFMQFDFYDKYMILRWSESGKIASIKVGLDGQGIEDIHRVSYWDRPLLSHAYWDDDKSLIVVIRSIEECTTLVLRCIFEGESLRVAMRESIKDFDEKYTELVGRQQEKTDYGKTLITFDN